MKLVAGGVLVLLLWAWRLARWVVALQAIAALIGTAGGAAVAVLLAVARLTWPIRLAAVGGLIALWHWPWWAALLFALPRVLLQLPGYVRTLTANWRHPRPLWLPPAELAAQLQTAPTGEAPP